MVHGEEPDKRGLHGGNYKCQHAQQQLNTMQQHCVPGLFHRDVVGGGSLGSQHDLKVGKDQCEENKGEVDGVHNAVFHIYGVVSKQYGLVAEDGGVEEGDRLFGQRYEEVCEGHCGRQSQNGQHKPESAFQGADVPVVQRETNRDVSLDGHASQDEWRGARGGHGGDDEHAAHGGVDAREGVTHHIERRHQTQLQRVVDHHVDKHDVARVLIEEVVAQEGGHHAAVDDTQGQPHQHGHNVFGQRRGEAVFGVDNLGGSG